MRPFFSFSFSRSDFIFTLLTTVFLSCLGNVKNASANSGGPCVLDSVVVIQPTCNGVCDGSVNLYINVSTTLYFSWQNLPGVTTPDITGVCAGTYYFIITDS